MIVAIDMGYGYTKAVTLAGNRERIAIFPSAYGPVARVLHDGQRRGRLEVGKEAFYFGEDALKFSRAPVTSRDRERPAEMLEVLLLAAFSGLEIYDGEVELHTALPVEWLGDADRLRGVLSGRHVGYRLDQGHKKINVCVSRPLGDDRERSGVSFYPQPLATFLSWATHDPGLWEEWATVLVIDVGTGTYNECLIVGGDWIDERATSKPLGMGTVLEAALQDQEAQTGRRDLLHIARAKLWAREVGMMALAQPHIDALADDVLQTAADVVGNISLSLVILTGGGAHFVQQAVRSRFPDLVVISSRPELDNVRGLLDAALAE